MSITTTAQRGLILKMRRTGVNPRILHLTYSYLSNREFFIKLGSYFLAKCFSYGGFADLPPVTWALLAMNGNDTVPYTTLRDEVLLHRRLQNAVVDAVNWSCRWKLQIKEDKCVAIRFIRRRCPPHDDIYVWGTRFLWSISVRYLGVTLHPKLTFNPNNLQITSNFLDARSLLLPLLCPNLTYVKKLKQ